MPLGSKTITRRLELALDAGSRAQEFAVQVEAKLLEELAPHFEEGKEPPDIRYFIRLLGRSFGTLVEALSQSDFERQKQASVSKFLKDQERKAAQVVRTLLTDTRFLLDRTLGREKATQHFEGRSALGRLSSAVLLRVGGKLVNLMRDEAVGWQNYPADDHLTPRAILADKLEAAMAELQQVIEAGRPDRSALSRTSSKWKRDIDDNTRRLQRRIKVIQAILIDAGLVLEAKDLQPKQRKVVAIPDEAGNMGTGAPTGGAEGGATGAPSSASRPPASAPRRRGRRSSRKALVPAVTTAS